MRKHKEIIEAWLDGKELQGRKNETCDWEVMSGTFNPMTYSLYEWEVIKTPVEINFIDFIKDWVIPPQNYQTAEHAFKAGWEACEDTQKINNIL